MKKLENYFIHDDILSQKELLWLYHTLIEQPSWTLSRTSNSVSIGSKPFNSFPGLLVEQSGLIKEEYLSGYFKSIIFRVQNETKKKYFFELPDKVFRIALGAKSSFSNTTFHSDHQDKDYWTILGFLNPIWNSKDGGHLLLEDKEISYLPGRFIVFPSSIKHNGGNIKNQNLNYWRISLNIILKK